MPVRPASPNGSAAFFLVIVFLPSAISVQQLPNRASSSLVDKVGQHHKKPWGAYTRAS